MQSSDLVQPLALQTPFAINGNKIIPNQNAAGTETSSINLGFLPITSEPLDDGGLPPERTDFNGMFYLSTDQRVFLQNGGFITYKDDVATKIGGYPKGAILGYLDLNNNFDFVVSLVENNQNTNFNTDPSYIDGTHWAFCSTSALNKNVTVSLTGAVTGSNSFNLKTDNSVSITTTGKSKAISLTGAVTGSATMDTGNTSAVTIATTGKNKTVSLTGAVTGSATLNTGNTDTVSISTTGKSKTISLTGVILGSATLNTGNTNTVSIATSSSTLANTSLSNLVTGLKNTIANTAPTTSSSASAYKPAVVVENYKSGTSGYRVWSDGLIEQWGIGKGSTTINLIKSYTSTNYMILGNTRNKITYKMAFRNIELNSFEAAQTTYNTSSGGNGDFSWYTIGF